MAESSSTDVSQRGPWLRVFRGSRLSAASWLIIASALLAAGVWLFMDQLVAVGNSIHGRITAKPAPELPEDLSRDERLMYTISHIGGPPAVEAVEEIVAADDKRFIAVMIEMLRANESLQIVFGAGAHRHLYAAEALADRKIRAEFGELANAWIKWYVTTDYEPPQGFTTWKGRFFSRFDPIYAELLRDEHPSRIRVEEVRHGGIPFDAIRPIDNPKMMSPSAAEYLEPDEPVFGLVVNGDARAYPQRILDWHEMVNDIVGGVPVSLSYCSLCGAAIAFDGRGPDGATYTFGSSGLLYRSNKLMFDRQTKTLWNQFTGKPVLGRLVSSDPQLEQIPVVVAEWQDWRADHPETIVMDRETGYRPDYQQGSAYGEYYASDETMFPVGQTDDRLPLKSRVFGVRFGNLVKAYPLDTLAKKEVVNDELGKQPLVLVALRDTVNVNGSYRRREYDVQAVSYEAGAEVRAFDRGERQFHPGPDDQSVLDENGTPWKVTEQALVAPDGQTASRIFGIQSYWFGWYAFNEDTLLYDPPAESSEAAKVTE